MVAVMPVITMARFNRGIRPVQRIKHVVDQQGGLIAATVQNIDLASSNDNPSLANTAEVQTGSTVNGIYIKCEVYATSTGALANAYFMLVKNPGDNLTFPNPNVVGSNDNKRYVIHQEMVMLEKNTTGNPRTLLNGVIVIPKGYRRMGPNDKLRVVLFSPGVSADFCLQAHYKEFR